MLFKEMLLKRIFFFCFVKPGSAKAGGLLTKSINMMWSEVEWQQNDGSTHFQILI